MARTTWVASLAWRVARRGFGRASASDVDAVAQRFEVDPQWDRLSPEGDAARLDSRTTISVRRPVGRWVDVDPRRPQDAWRSPWKAVGLVAWGATVGTAWWLGSSRGRGPLAILHEER